LQAQGVWVVNMTAEDLMTATAGGALIGLAAVLMMATIGRIAGVSGFASRLFPPYADDQLLVRVAFVAGLIGAPLVFTLLAGRAVPVSLTAGAPLLIVGGLLVGFGAVRGGGCTSGHGVCGMARLSRRSIIATLTFMATAAVTVFVMRHVIGG